MRRHVGYVVHVVSYSLLYEKGVFLVNQLVHFNDQLLSRTRWSHSEYYRTRTVSRGAGYRYESCTAHAPRSTKDGGYRRHQTG